LVGWGFFVGFVHPVRPRSLGSLGVYGSFIPIVLRTLLNYLSRVSLTCCDALSGLSTKSADFGGVLAVELFPSAACVHLARPWLTPWRFFFP
jgi:hypothetical protein